MTEDALVLIGRETPHAREVLETHARRLERRGIVDAVHVALYEREPGRELPAHLAGVNAGVVYAVPMAFAHTRETTEGVPAALSTLSGDVRYCEPIGRSPASTAVIADRAEEARTGERALVLVAFGNGAEDHQRRAAEYHAARLREETDYDEVVASYLLENPAVECARYGYAAESAVAVPLFLARSAATDREIPEKLELDRGGVAYAEPLGDHPRLTDAIEAEVGTQRLVGESSAAGLTERARRLATDGRGDPERYV
ncbi:sirohydrochlorin chelatase [Halegenticoccus tardaugens]|uniref:sirohydrochlorin chelatase n=1 Tax=Halegenticoccus tardaugens TaxID=2071624 RepID=UPI00100BB3A1|nr:sirohydrochlorin chelatase [Halegenticoccus tardaugens]